ncbi:MAG TPA: hypothetical protein VFW46_14805, partial [Stellaceae bacterium]|nr:hypothetical protein [Stellaceae bacterium]
QEKFERASAARRAAEAERDAALARLAELAASRPADPPAPPAPAEPARPDRAAFANPDDYDAAIVEWAAEKAARRVQDATRQSERQRLAEEAERARRQESATESERVNAAFFDRRAKFMAATPDYIEVAEAEDLPISRVMAEAILLDEHGPQIAYWLGENPEEAARIAGMTRGVYQSGQMAGLPAPDAARQLLEIGRIAARITAPSAKAPTAPAPIAPMRAAAAAAVAKSPEDETMEEYASRRLAALSRH